jgi:hypothetical protein
MNELRSHYRSLRLDLAAVGDMIRRLGHLIGRAQGRQKRHLRHRLADLKRIKNAVVTRLRLHRLARQPLGPDQALALREALGGVRRNCRDLAAQLR